MLSEGRAQARVAKQSKAGIRVFVLVRRFRRRARRRRSHPFDTSSGQQAVRSIRVFIADASLRDVGNGGDAGMWVEPNTGQGRTLTVDEVEEHERFRSRPKLDDDMRRVMGRVSVRVFV
jgi:hypothetical protein